MDDTYVAATGTVSLKTSKIIATTVRFTVRDSYRIMSSMKPMALAAREPRGPAEIVLTRMPYLRPASYESTRVSLSNAALALLMPPP